MNQIAGAAIALGKALQPSFRDYASAVLANARTLADALLERGAVLVTGGTDNHMMVLDCVQSFGIDGRTAEEALDRVSITCNKQVIPDDPNPPLRPSGIRLGTPAATTRGMGGAEMKQLAEWIVLALRKHEDDGALAKLKVRSGDHLPRVPGARHRERLKSERTTDGDDVNPARLQLPERTVVSDGMPALHAIGGDCPGGCQM